MRLLLATILGCLPAAPALAHITTADSTLSARILHQFFGAHHWPVMLLAVLAIYAGARYLQRRNSARHRRR